MATNGIHYHVDPATLNCTVGDLWVPIPVGGMDSLPPEARDVLARHVGPQGSGSTIRCLTGVSASRWDAVVARAIEVAASETAAAAKAQAEREAALAAWRERAALYCAGDERYYAHDWPAGALYATADAGGGYCQLPSEAAPDEAAAVEQERQRRGIADAAKQIAIWLTLDSTATHYDTAINLHSMPTAEGGTTCVTLRVFTPEQRQLVAATLAERELAQAARERQQEADSAAEAERIRTARLHWLRSHGTPDQIERFENGVLPLEELQGAVRAARIPETISAQYRPRTREDIDHCDACNDCEIRVKWHVEDAADAPLTVNQWRTLKEIRAAMAASDPSADVTVRKHTAKLSCDCPDPFWLSVRVLIELPELDLRVQRQFEL